MKIHSLMSFSGLRIQVKAQEFTVMLYYAGTIDTSFQKLSFFSSIQLTLQASSCFGIFFVFQNLLYNNISFKVFHN